MKSWGIKKEPCHPAMDHNGILIIVSSIQYTIIFILYIKKVYSDNVKQMSMNIYLINLSYLTQHNLYLRCRCPLCNIRSICLLSRYLVLRYETPFTRYCFLKGCHSNIINLSWLKRPHHYKLPLWLLQIQYFVAQCAPL